MKIYGALKTLFVALLLRKEAFSLEGNNSIVDKKPTNKNEDLKNFPIVEIKEFNKISHKIPSADPDKWQKSKLSSHVKEIYNERYNFMEDGKSVYDNRFSSGREVAEGEEYFLSSSFREVVDNFKKSEKDLTLNSKKSVFTIFSFGCGSGRDLQFFSNLAKELQDVGSKLVVKAYDISAQGLESYKAKLVSHKFSEGNLENKKQLKSYGVLSKGNFEVQLYSPYKPEIDPRVLAQSIGNVDITCSLYGPTSHIFPSKLRDEFLAEFVKMTREKVILTVPGHAFALDSQKIWGAEEIRENFYLERGEVFYRASDLEVNLPENKNKSPKDKDWERINLPIKLYDMDLLNKWLDNAGIKKEDAVVAVSNYKTNPDFASKNPNSGWTDSYLAYAASVVTSYAPEFVKLIDQNYFLQPLSRVEYYGLNIKGGAEKTPSVCPELKKEKEVNRVDQENIKTIARV